MIDTVALQRAYEADSVYALQLEVGDVCYQDCVYCYMNALDVSRNSLDDELIARILHDAFDLGISAVEWLGGEPLLRDTVFDHMALARDLGFRNNIWTGGLPLQQDTTRRAAARLARNGLIAVHVSTVDPDLYTMLHLHRGADDLATILHAVADLLDLGYPPEQMLNSVTFTGLQPVSDTIATMQYFQERFGIKTCLNVYHTYLRPSSPMGSLEGFIPARANVARLYDYYARHWGLDSYPMNCVNQQYCSATMAVLNDGSVTPCATIRGGDHPNLHEGSSLREIFREHRDEIVFKALKSVQNRPEECRACALRERCWGCRSRAFSAGLGLYGRDPRCFRA
jgi:radical SAM protein with 4Fe4S-binding SPASM domain